MPSFDIESKIDNHELSNAIDQTNRVITNRYDLKDANANVALQENEIKVFANESFQLDQIIPILKENLSKRKIDLKSLKIGETHEANNSASVNIELVQGISSEIGKEINALIKSKKMKVQSSIQGDSVRVSGKKRDDLQAAIALIKEQNFSIPLQFQNFRD
ncbi:MAG: YajQ family cyclic di-GMP-binding protein [SAR86 cluster bacterium]|uniref:Nucleotide-binding protein ISQ63_01740 n=1 Tax=SAR86 cluster bacterium TaxID=2030880 RepID=A0A937I4B7_9GAMM|nr:YajQ family cyclic di-GMP-binding protein [SAR86 cluster bacterium]